MSEYVDIYVYIMLFKNVHQYTKKVLQKSNESELISNSVHKSGYLFSVSFLVGIRGLLQISTCTCLQYFD